MEISRSTGVRASASAARRDNRGFTLIELLVAVAIIGLATALAVPMYADAVRKARTTALHSDGEALYGALMRYYKDHSSFPPDDDLDTVSLAPLTTNGYLSSGEAITNKLVGGQLLIYVAPDFGGPDQQFVTVMRHAADPTILIAVVHTNLVTDDGGWVDGTYVIDDGDLAEAGL